MSNKVIKIMEKNDKKTDFSGCLTFLLPLFVIFIVYEYIKTVSTNITDFLEENKILIFILGTLLSIWIFWRMGKNDSKYN